MHTALRPRHGSTLTTVFVLGAALSLGAGCSSAAEVAVSGESGLHDYDLRGDSAKCTPGGLYCGGDKVTGNTSYLYRCDATGVPEVERCPGACVVNVGTNDACAPTHTAAEALALVRSFYGKAGPFPTVDIIQGAAKSPYLTPELKEHLVHQPFVPGEGAAFTCAQEIPNAITVDAPTVTGDEAKMTVHLDFGGDYPVIATVRLSDLKISGWTCTDARMHTLAEAHEALRKYYGDHGVHDWNVGAMVDPDLKAKINATWSPGDDNPIACMQEEATAVSVDPAVAMGDAAVMTVRQAIGPNYNASVVVSVGLTDLKIHSTLCAPFTDGGPWMR